MERKAKKVDKEIALFKTTGNPDQISSITRQNFKGDGKPVNALRKQARILSSNRGKKTISKIYGNATKLLESSTLSRYLQRKETVAIFFV